MTHIRQTSKESKKYLRIVVRLRKKNKKSVVLIRSKTKPWSVLSGRLKGEVIKDDDEKLNGLKNELGEGIKILKADTVLSFNIIAVTVVSNMNRHFESGENYASPLWRVVNQIK
ncbi:hypothetical protein RJT34_19984 [Clitoria ternatea]|uniref:Nudix hydrolase domain-containing protein n=1 Tax=Clitoria ternatea TaxID=43366 RepID=A0AAN9IS19_CLITE